MQQFKWTTREVACIKRRWRREIARTNSSERLENSNATFHVDKESNHIQEFKWTTRKEIACAKFQVDDKRNLTKQFKWATRGIAWNNSSRRLLYKNRLIMRFDPVVRWNTLSQMMIKMWKYSLLIEAAQIWDDNAQIWATHILHSKSSIIWVAQIWDDSAQIWAPHILHSKSLEYSIPWIYQEEADEHCW